jgi:hypothetical protein
VRNEIVHVHLPAALPFPHQQTDELTLFRMGIN